LGVGRTVAQMEYVVETHALTKRFGNRTAVDRVELRVPRGSAFGYLGPNGAGKTTLIRILLGLLEPSEGNVSLLGLPQPQERKRALARVGAIVEEPRFHAYLTGRQNLTAIAAARGAAAGARIEPALERVGLRGRADHRVGTYSLGMRQRLGVAACLLADPELLILDEPMNGLDPGGMHELRELLRSFVDEGRTVVLSSHLLDEVERTCDAVAIVDRGRIVAQGSLAHLTASGTRRVRLATGDEVRAHKLLAAAHEVREVARDERGLIVTLQHGAAAGPATARLVQRLVAAGVAVYRVEPGEATLEQRFHEITARLGHERDEEGERDVLAV